MQYIPCFYHPTTITLIDDDKDLLNSLQLALIDDFKCNVFTSPKEAEKHISMHYQDSNSIKNQYLSTDYEDLSALSVDVGISKIHEEIFNQNRFDTNLVLVIDYDMPEMNGLDLARSLKHKYPVKIIMLTGEADTDTAVNAFNSKEIDRFLLKSSVDYNEKLIQYIRELETDHFLDQSKSIFEAINKDGKHPIQDKDFIQLFNRLCTEHNICEYYLIDDAGSFLLNPIAGDKPILLVVRTPDDAKTFSEIAENEDGATDELLNSIVNMEKIIYAPGEDGIAPPLSEWQFKDAIKIDGKDIYYAVFNEKEEAPLDTKNASSYSQYLTLT